MGTNDQWEAATMGYNNIGPNYWKGEEGREDPPDVVIRLELLGGQSNDELEGNIHQQDAHKDGGTDGASWILRSETCPVLVFYNV